LRNPDEPDLRPVEGREADDDIPPGDGDAVVTLRAEEVRPRRLTKAFVS
jgi:hypothetical protein